MLRALLASTLLLIACGGNPPLESADPPADELSDVSALAPFTSTDSDPGTQQDKCAAAQCNDHRDRDEYRDPADQRARLHAQDTSTSTPSSR